MNDLSTLNQEVRRVARNKRLRDINALIDEATNGNYTHVVTVGHFAELLQERNAILLQQEAETNRKLATPLEREAAEYENTHRSRYY